MAQEVSSFQCGVELIDKKVSFENRVTAAKVICPLSRVVSALCTLHKRRVLLFLLGKTTADFIHLLGLYNEDRLYLESGRSV